MDLTAYRQNPREQARLRDLMERLPKGRRSVLDVGARDGHVSAMLTGYFPSVTALDLVKPAFVIEGVETVQGDATALSYPDGHFDTVFCAEVLEHIPSPLLAKACSELARVARYEVVIGVPYRQDLRRGRATCQRCGRHNPPWGHVNSFDEAKLARLFHPLRAVSQGFVGVGGRPSNAVTAKLMDLAGNPWGNYNQEEPCLHCGAPLLRPDKALSFAAKLCTGAAWAILAVQDKISRPGPMWIHTVFAKAG